MKHYTVNDIFSVMVIGRHDAADGLPETWRQFCMKDGAVIRSRTYYINGDIVSEKVTEQAFLDVSCMEQ